MQEDHKDLENRAVKNEPNQAPQQLGKGQKIAAAFLAVFAVLVIIMWAGQFKKNISEPFAYKGGSSDKQTNVCQGPGCQEDSEESLKNKDTDGDGLSDWDELYFYNTSPYLEDSDSDGFIDKQEVDNDQDPNCPAGRDCYGSGIVEGDEGVVSDKSDSQNSSSLNSLLDQFNVTGENQSGLSQTGPGAGANELEALFGAEMNAATLRQLLLEHGMDKKILDKISDEQLMESFGEMMGS
ncbi:MAG: hypothetical protein U9R14_04120 [Patescibacteria group bacterium]|nr:hypothetical protein [Patescibacteria group bacterium]